MVDNLEPIEEKDFNLEGKFVEKIGEGGSNSEKSSEKIYSPENKVERKEGQAEKDEAYSKILSKVKSSQPADEKTVSDDAKTAMTENTAEGKVEKLIQLAMQKGVFHAVKVARHLEDNYVLDEFHDRLLEDDLHDALIKNGLIKEI